MPEAAAGFCQLLTVSELRCYIIRHDYMKLAGCQADLAH